VLICQAVNFVAGNISNLSDHAKTMFIAIGQAFMQDTALLWWIDAKDILFDQNLYAISDAYQVFNSLWQRCPYADRAALTFFGSA